MPTYPRCLRVALGSGSSGAARTSDPPGPRWPARQVAAARRQLSELPLAESFSPGRRSMPSGFSYSVHAFRFQPPAEGGAAGSSQTIPHRTGGRCCTKFSPRMAVGVLNYRSALTHATRYRNRLERKYVLAASGLKPAEAIGKTALRLTSDM